MRHDFYQLISSLPLTEEILHFEGFGCSNPKPLGSYSARTQVDNILFTITICIMDSPHMPIPVNIGRDIFAKDTLICKENGISLEKTPQLAVNCICINQNQTFVNIDYIIDNFSLTQRSANIPKHNGTPSQLPNYSVENVSHL